MSGWGIVSRVTPVHTAVRRQLPENVSKVQTNLMRALRESANWANHNDILQSR